MAIDVAEQGGSEVARYGISLYQQRHSGENHETYTRFSGGATLGKID